MSDLLTAQGGELRRKAPDYASEKERTSDVENAMINIYSHEAMRLVEFH